MDVIFHGNKKLKNAQCKIINKEVQPIAQKMRRYPYHLRNAIKDEGTLFRKR